MSPNILVVSHVCAPTPAPIARSRRFVVDLATTNPIEFVEYEWMQDGRLCVSLHEVTETGLYSGQTIIFDGPAAAGSPVPSRVAMRLHYKELAIPGKPKARLPQGWRESPSNWESWVETFSKLRTGLASVRIRYAISPPTPDSPQIRGETTTLFDEECAVGEADFSNPGAEQLVQMYLQMNGMTVGNPAMDSEFLISAQREEMLSEQLYDDEAPIYGEVREPDNNVPVEPSDAAQPIFPAVAPQEPVKNSMAMDNPLQVAHQHPQLPGPRESGDIVVPQQQPQEEHVTDDQPYQLAPSQPADQFISLGVLPPPPPEPVFGQPALSSYSVGSHTTSLPPAGFPISGATTQLDGNTRGLPALLDSNEVNQPSRGTPSFSDHGRAIPAQSVSGTESVGSSRLQQSESNGVSESPNLARNPNLAMPPMSPNTGNTQSTGADAHVSKPMVSAPIPPRTIPSDPVFEVNPVGQKSVYSQLTTPPASNSLILQPSPSDVHVQPLVPRQHQQPPLPVTCTPQAPLPPSTPLSPPSHSPPLSQVSQPHPHESQPTQLQSFQSEPSQVQLPEPSQPSKPQPQPQPPAVAKETVIPQSLPQQSSVTNNLLDINGGLPSVKQRVSVTPEHEVPTLDMNQSSTVPGKVTAKGNSSVAGLPVNGGIVKPQTKMGKREHVCECGKVFAHKGHFNAHRKAVHEKIRGHKCTYKDCDRAFAKRGDLLRHQMSQHAEDVRYPCSQCNVSFPDKQALAKHYSEVHDQVRPHKCQHCPKSYSTRSGLRKHIQRKHERAAVPSQQVAEAPAVM